MAMPNGDICMSRQSWLVKGIHGAVALAACVALGSCQSDGDSAEESRDRVGQMRQGVADAATTPLRDLGIIRPDIPPVLAAIRFPYEVASLAAGCTAVAYEIGQLDAVLGVENYQPGEERSWSERGADSAADAASGAVRGTGEVLPFRGWVRQASGANRAEREAIQAFEMGQMRRAFLRGYGASLGCRGIIPQPPPR
jgi:hypothetical protein